MFVEIVDCDIEFVDCFVYIGDLFGECVGFGLYLYEMCMFFGLDFE